MPLISRSPSNVTSLTPKLRQTMRPPALEKEPQKEALQNQIKQFRDDAEAGIDIVLLTSEGRHYVNGKFFLNRVMGTIRVQHDDECWHESSIVNVQGVYDDFQTLNNCVPHMTGDNACQNISLHDQKRAIVIVYCEDKNPNCMQKLCLLAPDAATQDEFISKLKVLIWWYKWWLESQTESDRDRQRQSKWGSVRASRASLSSGLSVLKRHASREMPVIPSDNEGTGVASQDLPSTAEGKEQENKQQMVMTEECGVKHQADSSATQLRDVGYVAADLKEAGYTATELKEVGYTIAELREAGYTTAELKQAGHTATELKENTSVTASEVEHYEQDPTKTLPARPVHFHEDGLMMPVPVLPICNAGAGERQKSVDADEPSSSMNRGSVKRTSTCNSPAAKISKHSEDCLTKLVSQLDYQVWKSKDGLSGSLVVPSADHEEVSIRVQRSKVSCKVLVNDEVCIDTTCRPLKFKTFESVVVGWHSVDVYESKDGSFEVFVDKIPFNQLNSWVRADVNTLRTPEAPQGKVAKTSQAKAPKGVDIQSAWIYPATQVKPSWIPKATENNTSTLQKAGHAALSKVIPGYRLFRKLLQAPPEPDHNIRRAGTPRRSVAAVKERPGSQCEVV